MPGRLLNEPGLTTGILITNTDELAGGDWGAIQFVADTKFTKLTSDTLSVQGDVTTPTFKAGVIIYGHFTVIDLASGAVIAYDAR